MSYAVNGFGVADLSWMPSWVPQPGAAFAPLTTSAPVLPDDSGGSTSTPVAQLVQSMPKSAPAATYSGARTVPAFVLAPNALQSKQAGMYAGWAVVLAAGGYGVSLLWKAMHGGRRG
jgi:hypothetical protein